MVTDKLKYFPYAYYISLEESTERQKILHEQFSKYGVNNITPVLSKRFAECDDKVKGEMLHILDAGTTGCVISHLKAIQKWYEETDDDYAFFCEDDLSLETVEYWNFTWGEFIEKLPDDAECVQLTSIRPSFDVVCLRERSMYDWSVTAYIMTREYAKKVLERHIADDEYDLTIPGTGFYPMPENVIFYGLGKVYTVELFVENSNVTTTFNQIEGGYKEYHKESYDFVSNWWKTKYTSLNQLFGLPETKMKTQLEELLIQYSLDTENPEHNFTLGLWYENEGHTAPALSYFLRCAERASDDVLAYEALIHGSICYDRQGTREGTAKGLLQQALVLVPTRPEAYFLLAQFAEKRTWWQDCYIYADNGLRFADLNAKPLKTDVGYPGTYGLLFEKAVSGWWWGKNEESGAIFKDLYENHDMQEAYRNVVLDNLKKYFPTHLVPPNFDWGETNPEYAQMFTNENFIERTYEKHCRVKSGDVVIDAGANCGSFTHSILGKKPKQVYCVEPSNTLIHSLKKNVGHGPVTFINKAISDFESDNMVIADKGVYIYENDGNIYPTTTFKKIIEDNNITRVDFLKFDCEGGEYSIFTEENCEFIANSVGHCAGEWHINDHKDAIERFIKFRDLYLTKCKLLHVYERNGKEVTEHLFDDNYLYGFREYWKDTYLGQFIMYFTFNNSVENEVDVVEINESEKMDIVLQGQYEEYTDEIIEEYLKLPFVNNIIVSCWDEDIPDSYCSNRVKYVRSSYPLTPGTCNKNLQITTSFAGIKLCRAKFSAKMRSDQKYDYASMTNMYEFFMENHTEGRIFVAGTFPSLLFHPRDHIYWGETKDLHTLFDIPLEYNSLIDKVRIGKYELAQYANYLTRPETYIGAHYCTHFDDRVKKMLIEPEKYLYDGAPMWSEAYAVSTEVLPKAFKCFPSTGINLVWPRRGTYSYPYEDQKLHSNECWHEDGF
jgi:FkbM family methyltransferase